MIVIINGRAAETSINYIKNESLAICGSGGATSVRVKIFPVRIKVIGDSGYAEFHLSAECSKSHSVAVKITLKKKVGRWCVTDSSVDGSVKRNLDFCER